MKKETHNIPDTSSELVSMNEHLHLEFSIDELEARLETDPLLLSSILDLDDGDCKKCNECNKCNNGDNDTCNCNTINAEVEV